MLTYKVHDEYPTQQFMGSRFKRDQFLADAAEVDEELVPFEEDDAADGDADDYDDDFEDDDDADQSEQPAAGTRPFQWVYQPGVPETLKVPVENYLHHDTSNQPENEEDGDPQWYGQPSIVTRPGAWRGKSRKKKLTDMGFEEVMAERALAAHGGHLQRAADALAKGPPRAHILSDNNFFDNWSHTTPDKDIDKYVNLFFPENSKRRAGDPVQLLFLIKTIGYNVGFPTWADNKKYIIHFFKSFINEEIFSINNDASDVLTHVKTLVNDKTYDEAYSVEGGYARTRREKRWIDARILAAGNNLKEVGEGQWQDWFINTIEEKCLVPSEVGYELNRSAANDKWRMAISKQTGRSPQEQRLLLHGIGAAWSLPKDETLNRLKDVANKLEPGRASSQPHQPRKPEDAPKDAPAANDEWLVVVSDTHGRNYYYNKRTGVSTWDRPGKPAPPPAADNNWTEIIRADIFDEHGGLRLGNPAVSELLKLADRSSPKSDADAVADILKAVSLHRGIASLYANMGISPGGGHEEGDGELLNLLDIDDMEDILSTKDYPKEFLPKEFIQQLLSFAGTPLVEGGRIHIRTAIKDGLMMKQLKETKAIMMMYRDKMMEAIKMKYPGKMERKLNVEDFQFLDNLVTETEEAIENLKPYDKTGELKIWLDRWIKQGKAILINTKGIFTKHYQKLHERPTTEKLDELISKVNNLATHQAIVALEESRVSIQDNISRSLTNASKRFGGGARGYKKHKRKSRKTRRHIHNRRKTRRHIHKRRRTRRRASTRRIKSRAHKKNSYKRYTR